MTFRISGLLALTTLLITSAWMPSSSANENNHDNGYFSASLLRGTYDIDGVADTQINIVDFRFGKMITDYIGLEGRFGFGINDGTDDNCSYVNNVFTCATTGINLDHYYGAYARGYFMPSGAFRPYGLIGYSKGDASINEDGAMYDQSESGVTYGVGLEMGKSRASFTLEYLSVFDADGSSLSGFSIGLITRF